METLDLTDRTDGKAVGKHSVWLPPKDGLWGVKVPFQFGGYIQKYQKPQESAYPIDALDDEIALLHVLHHRGYAPPLRERIYYKTVISEHLGHWWADPVGAYGYEMADATRLHRGPVTTDTIDELRREGQIIGSEGAWNDLLVPERQNILNGWIIDVRRSGFDTLRLRDGHISMPPRYIEDRQALAHDLNREGSFPFRERREPYQDIWLDGQWHRGERRIVERAEVLGFWPRPSQTVLDLGTCLGGFLQYAKSRSIDAVLVGLDVQPEFVALARRLARANYENICYRQADLTKPEDGLLDWLMAVFPHGVDHLLCLSMGKHLSAGVMWWWIDTLRARRTYLETNAVNAQNPWPLREAMEARGGRWVGDTTDRHQRRCYVIECK